MASRRSNLPTASFSILTVELFTFIERDSKVIECRTRVLIFERVEAAKLLSHGLTDWLVGRHVLWLVIN